MIMSRSRRRAKTATVAFPVMSEAGYDPTLRDGFMSNAGLVDYPFPRRSVFNSPEKRYSTLPINKTDKGLFHHHRGIPTPKSSKVKSMSNIFSLPPPPPLNPKLKILKSMMSSKQNANAVNSNFRLTSETEDFQNMRTNINTNYGSNTDQFVPTTPTLPPKLRAIKAKPAYPKVAFSPKTKRKTNPASKSTTTTRTTGVSDSLMETLPSLTLSLVPASNSNQGNPSEERLLFAERQVYRSEEERAESPEALHLDRKGLKQFPFLGSEENCLKLLSLQHNHICRLENLPSLSHLLVLDLYNNRVERITGIQVFHSLRVLLLGKNRIRRIEGLDGLKRLEILDLHGNQLRYIDNLTSLASLRVLNLAGNLIRSIRNLGPYGLSSLTELNLKRNRIKNLDGLQKAPHLRKLLLANNELQSISALHPLRKMLFLQELLLESNPICSLPEYTSQTLTLFPWLTTLDKVPVTDQMRLDAKGWHRRRLAQEEEKRKEQEKLRLTAASTREEIIHEARRRWESVKTFVKQTHGENPVNQDQELTNLPKTNQYAAEFRRAKSEPRSGKKEGYNNVDSLRHRLQISANIIAVPYNGRDGSPFPVSTVKSTDNSKLYTREDSVVTTLTKSINLQKREPESISRSTAEMKMEVPVGHICRSFNNQPEPYPETETETNNEEYVEQPSLQKLTKVAVVRPLIRTSPSRISEHISEQEVPLNSNFDLEFTPRSFLAEKSLSVQTEVKERDGLVDTQHRLMPVDLNPLKPNFENEVTSIGFTEQENHLPSIEPIHTDLQIDTKWEMPFERQITLGDINAINRNREVIESASRMEIFKSPVEDVLYSNEPGNIGTVEIATRPVFRRSASTCVLSAVPNSVMGLTSSSGSSSATSSNINISGIKPNEVESVEKYLIGGGESRVRQISNKSKLASFRSNSVDVQLPTSDSDTFDVGSMATSTNIEFEIGGRKQVARTLFSRRGRLKRGQTARASGSISISGAPRRPVTGIRDRNIGNSPLGSGRGLKRRDSITAVESPTSNVLKKQGADYLVEIDGKTLSLYGQGALKHMLTGFPSALVSNVSTVKFHFISYDTIIPHFGKLRQTYPALEHVQFRANNICVLAQLNALADFQGLFSLQISKEGNPIVENENWQNYAIYRLAHWGLQQINGKEIPSEYRGGTVAEESKVFESLGYLALSCLPQTALTPLAKKLHTLHCFCCCSPSSSSDESGRRKVEPGGDGESSGNICTSWDHDPVLLDVIGKEALVYLPPKTEVDKTCDLITDVGTRIVSTGREMIEKLDMLETTWPTLLVEVVEGILIDYLCMDNYMKKELRKLKDLSLANSSKKSKS